MTVHFVAAAHHLQIPLTTYHGDKQWRIEVDEFTALWPDRHTVFHPPWDDPFEFFWELDCSTETLRSKQDIETWEDRIRRYEYYLDSRRTKPFRVVVVTVRSKQRMQNILDLAADVLQNKLRPLLYGIYLPDFLDIDDPLTMACFRDHRGESIALIPPPAPHTHSPRYRHAPSRSLVTV